MAPIELGRRLRAMLTPPPPRSNPDGGPRAVLKAALEKAAVSRYAAVFLLLFFFATASAWIVRNNALFIGNAHSDEWHTLASGVIYLNPLSRKAGRSIVRVGEMNRWFVRFLYPLGVWYMNTRMGGNIVTHSEWYPGGFYLQRHYERLAGAKGRVGGAAFKEGAKRDPNVQDFNFFLRTALGLLAAACFCLALWSLFTRFNLAAAAAYGSLVLGSPLVFEQFIWFYSEAALFVVFNLAVFVCLQWRTPTYRNVIYLAVLAAAAVSTKLTGLLVAAPLFLYVAFNMRGLGPRAAPRIEVFVLFFVLAMAAINLGAGSPFQYLNQTLFNVWHYKTGHYMVLEGGLELLGTHLEAMGYLVVVLFSAAMLWFVRRPAYRLVPVYALGAGAALAVWSLSDAAMVALRNLSSLYVFMSFVVALFAGDLVRRLPAERQSVKAAGSMVLMLAVLASGASLVHGMPSLHDAFFDRTRGWIQKCGSVGAVGLPERDLGTLRGIAGGEVAAFPRVRGPFVPSRDHEKIKRNVPSFTAFLEENPGDVFERFEGFDCLVAYREGQTKQVTNLRALETYKLWRRAGNYFLFLKGGERGGS